MAFKNLLNLLDGINAKALPVVYDRPAIGAPALHQLASNAVLYPSDTGRTNIAKGFRANPIINAVASISAKKFSQINFYHYRVKREERKTYFEEYLPLTRTGMDTKAAQEARKMLKKSVDQVRIDSDLAKKLARPNRNQSGAQFREMLYLQKLLTGEGNQWLSRVDERGVQVAKGKPVELQVIPKANLVLVRGSDIWDIGGFVVVINVEKIPIPKDNIIMWINPNPEPELDGQTLNHLRGFAALDAGKNILQAFNEGAEKLVNYNKNQGAAGFATNETMDDFTPEQSVAARRQFDGIINNHGMVGKWGLLGGKWAVHQLGHNLQEMKLLEQMDAQKDMICNLMGYPPGFLEKNQTYENQRTMGRRWVFDTIAPAAYSLRDEWNAKLIPAFDLDRERDVVDCDVLALDELSEDLKTKKEAIKDLWQFTGNDVLEYLGYDRVQDPNMDIRFLPNNLVPLDEAAMPIGDGLED